jgi:hypothetical protein
MTKQSKDLMAFAGKAVALAAPSAYLIFWALNTAFVSHEEFKPVRAAVDSVAVRLRYIEEGQRLGNCLALAEKQGKPWQECLRQ